MKTYKSTETRKAAKIVGVRNDTHGSGKVNVLVLDDGEHFNVRPGWWEQKEAEVGGYLVVYEDGYASYCPADKFERVNIVSREPMLSLDQAKERVSTKTAPRVTEEAITRAIKDVDYLKHGVLCICIITMANGFKVVGKAAPADPANFDYQVGQRFAYNDAFKQLWPLMGFALCEDLHRAKEAGVMLARMAIEQPELFNKPGEFVVETYQHREVTNLTGRPDPRGDEPMPRGMEPQANEWVGKPTAEDFKAVQDMALADTTDTTSGADEPDHAA